MLESLSNYHRLQGRLKNEFGFSYHNSVNLISPPTLLIILIGDPQAFFTLKQLKRDMAKALMNLLGDPPRFIAQGIPIRRAMGDLAAMNKSYSILADKTIRDELGLDNHSLFHNHSSFHNYFHLIYCSS